MKAESAYIRCFKKVTEQYNAYNTLYTTIQYVHNIAVINMIGQKDSR